MKKILFFSVLLFSTIILNAQWYKIPQSQIPTFRTFQSVRFYDVNIGFAVGNFGTINKTNNQGNLWLSKDFTTYTLNSVFLTDSNTVFIVGDGGTIIKSTDGGNIWGELTSGINEQLLSVYFINSNIGFVSSSYGSILKTTNAGGTWEMMNSGSTYPLYSIFFINELYGFAVGGGTILKTTDGGNSWSKQMFNAGFESVFFVDTNTGYACGEETDILHDNYGVIYKTTDAGVTWARIYYDFSSYGLYSIFFLNNQLGYCVGNGPILKTTNGGISWEEQWANGNNTLREIYFINDSVGYTVGISGSIYKTTNGGENFIEIYILNENHFILYPNPATQNLTFIFEIPFILCKKEISIYSIDGSLKLHKLINENTLTIDISCLKSGFYIAKVCYENVTSIEKFVKQ